jgi:hypothetical protein
MDDELRRKLAEDLRKSGRASEMLALDTFVHRQWSCEGSVGFHDKDEDVGREIDLHAAFSVTRGLSTGGSVQFTFRVVGEVKKSEKPWVVLREHSFSPPDLVDAWTNLTYGVNLPDDRFTIDKELSRFSLLETTGWRGRGVHEAFKDPKNREASYTALIAACKASESALGAEENSLGQLQNSFAGSTFLTLIKPVVILDGTLAAATLTGGDVEIAPADGAAIRFQFRTARYTRETYNVDLVTLSYLSTYLELCERRTRNVVSALTDLADERRGQ